MIKEFRPDAIVSVYPLASLVLGRMRRKKQLRVPVLTYLTDFAVHSLWVHRGHRPSPRGQRDLGRGGRRHAAARTPRARGPLVSERFRDADVRPRRGAHATSASHPTTARCSWWPARGASATSSPPSRRSAGSGEFHPITVCGSDENLRAELEQRGYGTVIGWTDEMPALMTAADALVENAGGLTCMEAFAVGLPVITYLPIAGHGKDNAEMMARAGVNRYARDEDELHDDAASRSPRPGPERDALVDTARAAVRRRSRRRRRGAGADRAPRRPQGPGRRAAHAARPPHAR